MLSLVTHTGMNTLLSHKAHNQATKCWGLVLRINNRCCCCCSDSNQWGWRQKYDEKPQDEAGTRSPAVHHTIYETSRVNTKMEREKSAAPAQAELLHKKGTSSPKDEHQVWTTAQNWLSNTIKAAERRTGHGHCSLLSSTTPRNPHWTSVWNGRSSHVTQQQRKMLIDFRKTRQLSRSLTISSSNWPLGEDTNQSVKAN